MRACFVTVLGMAAFAPAKAASETVPNALAALQREGFASPAAAIRRLEAASARLGEHANVEERRRYVAALGSYAVQGDIAPVVENSLRELDTMARREHCRPCTADALLLRVHWALSREDLPAALHAAEQAAAVVDPRDEHMQLKLHLARARAYDQQGTLTRALAAAVRALSIADRLGANAERARLMGMMVGLNADLGDFKRAERIAHEAYALAKGTGYRYMMAHVRLQQGYLYGLSNQPARQEKVLREALHIAQGDPDLAMIEVIGLANLADYFLQTGDNVEALRFATRADAVASRLHDGNARAIAIANQGIAMAHMGRTEEGVAALRRALALAEALGAKGYVVSMQEELASILEKAGRPLDALESMRRVVAVTREITEQEREKAVLELQEKYSAERRSREIERLTATNRLNRAEVAARTWQQRLWAAVAVALGLALVPLVQLIQRARRANRRLSGDIAVLAEQSVHDPLTGAFNRRHCHALMNQHQAQLVRGDGRDYQRGVGLMLLDVDFFKKVNDHYGHAAGDEVLVEVAGRLRNLVRQQDAVVRWGGEEFVLVLPGTSCDGMAALAERVLAAVADQPVSAGGFRIPVTVSAGCASVPFVPGHRWEDALHVADLALYMSKAGGRNRATCVRATGATPDIDVLHTDLGVAKAQGWVELQTVLGPAPAAVDNSAASEAA